VTQTLPTLVKCPIFIAASFLPMTTLKSLNLFGTHLVTFDDFQLSLLANIDLGSNRLRRFPDFCTRNLAGYHT
jgi:hypothetical protein